MLGELFRAYAHTRPSRANFFAPKLLSARRDETVNTNAGSSARLRETRDAFARRHSIKNGCFWRAMVPSVSLETEHAPAKVMTVSRESPAAPVDGGRARAGLETTRRAKLAARTARGRAAAHRHTQRPGPTAPTTTAAPHATPTRPPGHAKGAGTEVPAPCRLTQPPPRRGSGRMILSPGDGDASTGTCRQRRPLPGQPRRSGRRSRCERGPSSAWWPGRRARRNRSSRR